MNVDPKIYQALALANALKLYANTGMKANSAYTPKNMMAKAGGADWPKVQGARLPRRGRRAKRQGRRAVCRSRKPPRRGAVKRLARAALEALALIGGLGFLVFWADYAVRAWQHAH